jgi:hypothetical protein
MHKQPKHPKRLIENNIDFYFFSLHETEEHALSQTGEKKFNLDYKLTFTSPV